MSRPDEGSGMAQQTQTVLIDDMDGSPAAETVSFAIDGAAYQIELSEKNAGALRDLLAPYVGHARRAGRSSRGGGRTTGSPARVDREQTQKIREWARANGHQISDRGRVPAAVLEAYQQAH